MSIIDETLILNFSASDVAIVGCSASWSMSLSVYSPWRIQDSKRVLLDWSVFLDRDVQSVFLSIYDRQIRNVRVDQTTFDLLIEFDGVVFSVFSDSDDNGEAWRLETSDGVMFKASPKWI